MSFNVNWKMIRTGLPPLATEGAQRRTEWINAYEKYFGLFVPRQVQSEALIF